MLEHLLSIKNVGISAVALSHDKETLYLVGRDASVAVIDMPGRRVLSRTRPEVAPDTRLVYDSIDLSPDGSRLFLGLNSDQSSGWGQIDTISVYDTRTWDQVGDIAVRDPVIHFALSAAGDHLYAVSPEAQSLAVYDTTSFEQIAMIDGLGGTPARIIVPVATVN